MNKLLYIFITIFILKVFLKYNYFVPERRRSVREMVEK